VNVANDHFSDFERYRVCFGAVAHIFFCCCCIVNVLILFSCTCYTKIYGETKRKFNLIVPLSYLSFQRFRFHTLATMITDYKEYFFNTDITTEVCKYLIECDFDCYNFTSFAPYSLFTKHLRLRLVSKAFNVIVTQYCTQLLPHCNHAINFSLLKSTLAFTPAFQLALSRNLTTIVTSTKHFLHATKHYFWKNLKFAEPDGKHFSDAKTFIDAIRNDTTGLESLDLTYMNYLLPRLMRPNSFPPSITYLCLPAEFKSNLIKDILPPNLLHLTFGWGFNQELKKDDIPQGVTHLTFGRRFNQELKKDDIPHGVTHLIFGYGFNQELKKDDTNIN
jgi:hypothetical protein